MDQEDTDREEDSMDPDTGLEVSMDLDMVPMVGSIPSLVQSKAPFWERLSENKTLSNLPHLMTYNSFVAN